VSPTNFGREQKGNGTKKSKKKGDQQRKNCEKESSESKEKKEYSESGRKSGWCPGFRTARTTKSQLEKRQPAYGKTGRKTNSKLKKRVKKGKKKSEPETTEHGRPTKI